MDCAIAVQPCDDVGRNVGPPVGWMQLGLMPLPTSPDVNYVPGVTPVSAANLLNIQACIVGKKYQSSPIFLSGIDFQLQSGAATRAGHVWTFPSSINSIVAVVRFWPGTRITNLIWSFNNVADLTFEFTRRSFGNGGVTSGTISAGHQPASAGWITVDMAAASGGNGLPHTIADGFLYSLSLNSTPASGPGGSLFDGVKIIADRL